MLWPAAELLIRKMKLKETDMFSKIPSSVLPNDHLKPISHENFCLTVYYQAVNGHFDYAASTFTKETNQKSLIVRYFQLKSFPDHSYASL